MPYLSAIAFHPEQVRKEPVVPAAHCRITRLFLIHWVFRPDIPVQYASDEIGGIMLVGDEYVRKHAVEFMAALIGTLAALNQKPSGCPAVPLHNARFPVPVDQRGSTYWAEIFVGTGTGSNNFAVPLAGHQIL